MKPDDDWTRWAEAWRSQPPIDTDRLQRLVVRKRQHMRATVAFRVFGTAVAMALCVQMLLKSGLPWAGRAWFLFLIALAPVMLYVRLRQYRGTWLAGDGSVRSMLGITVKRARAGIRLARMSQVGACCAAILLPVLFWATSVPSISPATPVSQAHDVVVSFVVATLISTAIQAAIFLYALRYARREQRLLRDAEGMLTEVANRPQHHGAYD